MKKVFQVLIGFFLSTAFLAGEASAQKLDISVKPGVPGKAPFEIFVGQEFQIYDWFQKPFRPRIKIEKSEGYRTGSIERAAKDLKGLFDKYMPISPDPTLKYNWATFDASTARISINATKCLKVPILGTKCGTETAVGQITIHPVTCGVGTAGISIKLTNVPQSGQRTQDGFRGASMNLCYIESDRDVTLQIDTKMIPGTQSENWTSHVAMGMLQPLVAKLKEQILTHSTKL